MYNMSAPDIRSLQEGAYKVYPAHTAHPPHSRLFIVHSGDRISEDDFRNKFEQYGKIEKIHSLVDKISGNKKGGTYIKFSLASEAATAMEDMHGQHIFNSKRPIKVLIAYNCDEGRSKWDDGNSDERLTRLYVSVDKQMTDTQLRQEFSPYGNINHAACIKDKNNHNTNKGYAYVKFNKASSAALALENCDKKYKCVFATPKSDSRERNSGVRSLMDCTPGGPPYNMDRERGPPCNMDRIPPHMENMNPMHNDREPPHMPEFSGRQQLMAGGPNHMGRGRGDSNMDHGPNDHPVMDRGMIRGGHNMDNGPNVHPSMQRDFMPGGPNMDNGRNFHPSMECGFMPGGPNMDNGPNVHTSMERGCMPSGPNIDKGPNVHPLMERGFMPGGPNMDNGPNVHPSMDRGFMPNGPDVHPLMDREVMPGGPNMDNGPNVHPFMERDAIKDLLCDRVNRILMNHKALSNPSPLKPDIKCGTSESMQGVKEKTATNVVISTQVTDEQLWKLCDMFPGLDYWERLRKVGPNRIMVAVYYHSRDEATFAAQKLNGFEYPTGIGERIEAKVDDMCSGVEDVDRVRDTPPDTYKWRDYQENTNPAKQQRRY